MSETIYLKVEGERKRFGWTFEGGYDWQSISQEMQKVLSRGRVTVDCRESFIAEALQVDASNVKLFVELVCKSGCGVDASIAFAVGCCNWKVDEVLYCNLDKLVHLANQKFAGIFVDQYGLFNWWSKNSPEPKTLSEDEILDNIKRDYKIVPLWDLCYIFER